MSPSYVASHSVKGDGSHDSPYFEIHLFEGVGRENATAGGTIIWGPGGEGGLGDNGHGGKYMYYAYTYEKDEYLIYTSIRGGECGNQLVVPKQVIEDIRDAGKTPPQWSSTWRKIKEPDNYKQDPYKGKYLVCNEQETGSGSEAVASLEFWDTGVDLETIGSDSQAARSGDDSDSLYDKDNDRLTPKVALNRFDLGEIHLSTLAARGGDSYNVKGGDLPGWFWWGSNANTHTYQEISDDGDCGSQIHIWNLNPENPGESQILVGTWYDIHNGENPECNYIDNGSSDNEKQVFIVNYNFGDTAPSSNINISLNWSLDITGDTPVLTESEDQYIYLGRVDGVGIEVGDDHNEVADLHFFHKEDPCGRPVIHIRDGMLDWAGPIIVGRHYSHTEYGTADIPGISGTPRGDSCQDKNLQKPREDTKVIQIGLVSEANGGIDDLQGVTAAGGANRQEDGDCEGTVQNFGFGWILCPALNIASSALLAMEEKLENLLRVGPDSYNNDAYKDMWGSLRRLSTFAIVATALFMVISTAVNAGFFSNYTVKKYLPRLIAGVILIQLSYGMFTTFLDIMNELGDGINSILETASGLGGADWGLREIAGKSLAGENSGGRSGVAFAGGGVLGIVLLGGLGALGALSMLYSGAIALLFGFLFLILRKFIIVALVIFSPIGLALWILPGNDKAWRLYIKTFLTLVLMYPILVAIIALGKIFSQIAIEGNEGEVVRFSIAFMAYIGGYAAIPFMAKRFSGALGQLTGTLNDKSKGIFDKGKNKIEGYHKARKEFKGSVKQRKAVERSSGRLGAVYRAKRRLEGGMRTTGREGAGTTVRNLARRARGEDPVQSLEHRQTTGSIAATADKLRQEQVAEADSRMQQEDMALYESRGRGSPLAQAAIGAGGQDLATQEAALRRAVSVRDNEGVEGIIDHITTSGSGDQRAMLGRVYASGKMAESFNETDPHIGKGTSTGGLNFMALRDLSFDKFKDLSGGAMRASYGYHIHRAQQEHIANGGTEASFEGSGDEITASIQFGDTYLRNFDNKTLDGQKNWTALPDNIKTELEHIADNYVNFNAGTPPPPRASPSYDPATGLFVPPTGPGSTWL